MPAPSREARLFLCGPLIALAPLVTFLFRHRYPPLRVESGAAILLVLCFGAVAGCLLAYGGRFVRTLTLAGLVTLLVDLQTAFPGGISPASFFSIAACTVFLLPTNLLSTALPVAFGAFLAATALVPRLPFWTTVENSRPISARASLPLWIHLVLDEFQGLEAIPAQHDAGGLLAKRIRDVLANRGFRVFGRAYSRYFDTDESLSNLVNFTSTDRKRRFIRGGLVRTHLTRNAYFDGLVARGYELHAYQSTYLDICRPSMEGLKTCSTYDLETIDSVRDLDVSVLEKLKLILITFSRQSEVLKHTLGFPWKLSTVSGMRSLDRVFEDIATQGRDGTAFFAHLVTPHQPFTFDRECAVIPRTSDWLIGKDLSLTPKRNSDASRAVRYPRYLEQVACVVGKLERLLDRLAQTGRLDGATVIIHGDHGSRISLEEPRDVNTMVDSDYVDAYATLLAIKAPRVEAGYDRRLLALQSVFTAFVRRGSVPAGRQWGEPARVFLRSSFSRRMHARAMPAFARPF